MLACLLLCLKFSFKLVTFYKELCKKTKVGVFFNSVHIFELDNGKIT